MATSRSGAGGKIVTSRRKQRLAATPYDRPPPQPSPPPPPKSPNWFTGIIVPSARAIASGAGKILSSIFSESESSSSEDEDVATEDDIDDDNHYDGANTLNVENMTSSEMMRYGHESQLMWGRETKKVIEQLILKETFSREECDRLIKILNSRVMDWSVEAGEKSSFSGSPGKMVDHEDVEKAIQEAKKWFQDKKVGPSSVTEPAHGACNLNSTALEHVETAGGSPVDVARSYMKVKPPWTSPGGNIESRTPLTAKMKLFKEETLYSVGRDSLSSSKKSSSLASGWNIQEELRRVRSRVTKDMLRSPSTRTTPSLSEVAKIKVDSAGGERESAVVERMTELESFRQSKPIDSLIDAGVSTDPALAAFDSRHDGKASVGLLVKSATSVSGNNEVLEAVLVDVERPASKFISSPKNSEEQHAGPHSSKANGSPAAEATEFGGEEIVTALTSSQVSLSAGTTAVGTQHDNENPKTDNPNEKPTNTEGNCELLSEAYMEVPIVTETNSIVSGSQTSLGELSVDVAQPFLEEKVGTMAGKQQGRKPGKYNRKIRGRGK